MKSEIQKGIDLKETQLTSMEQSKFEGIKPQLDCDFSQIKPKRSIPRLIHLQIGNSRTINQKQKGILSNIIKLCAPQEDQVLLDQQFQLLITNQEYSLPSLAGRIVSKDEDLKSQTPKKFFLDNLALKSKISRIKKSINESNFSKIKNKDSYQSLSLPNQNPQYILQTLSKKIENLEQKVDCLEDKIKQKQISFGKKLKIQNQEEEKKDLKILKYQQKIKDLQEQNQRLRMQYSINSQPDQSLSLMSQLNQKSMSVIVKNSDNKILLNMSSPNISIQNQYSSQIQKNKNKSQVNESQKSLVQILKQLNKIKSHLSQSQKTIFKLRISQIL